MAPSREPGPGLATASGSSAERGLERLRRRTTAVFLGGVGLGSIGLIAAMVVSSLAAEEISGAATWSGLPAAMSILGTAAGTTLLAQAMQRWGRRKGLVVGYSVAILGAVSAISAVLLGSALLLVVAMFIIGLGRSGDSLSRYLVADLYPVGRRASAIGWVVWVGTIGAVIGPNSLGLAGQVARKIGLPDLSGAFLVTLCTYGLAAVAYAILLRPDPSVLVWDERDESVASTDEGFGALFRLSRVRVALVVMVVGHVVMVLIMSMTPLYLKLSGHGLGIVGFVMSSHIVGMFVFSPLTGRLVDRWGRLPVILIGQVLLLVAAVSAFLAPADAVGSIALALFLLGLGWNFGFVAGSALLSSGIRPFYRARLQGITDSMIWSSAALASATSGLILSGWGYQALCILGSLLLVIPAAVMLRYWRALVHSPASVSP